MVTWKVPFTKKNSIERSTFKDLLDLTDRKFSQNIVAANPVDGQKSCQDDWKDVANVDIVWGDFIVVVGPEKVDKNRGKDRHGGENDSQESCCEWQSNFWCVVGDVKTIKWSWIFPG